MSEVVRINKILKITVLLKFLYHSTKPFNDLHYFLVSVSYCILNTRVNYLVLLIIWLWVLFYVQESKKGDHIWERNGHSETIMRIFLLFKRIKGGSAEFFWCIIVDKSRGKWNTYIGYRYYGRNMLNQNGLLTSRK